MDTPQLPEYERDPQNWVSRILIHPALHHHLIRLPGVDQVDIVSAQAFADEVMQVALAVDLRYLTCVPLSGIDLETADVDVLTEDTISIRRLSDEEQAEWFNGNSEQMLWPILGVMGQTQRTAGPAAPLSEPDRSHSRRPPCSHNDR
ncbi:MAG: hypothetical protein ACRDQI_03010 [Pseudonocardiaceae bacterium]